jgi:thioredoxin-dependent peroxiredoxin
MMHMNIKTLSAFALGCLLMVASAPTALAGANDFTLKSATDGKTFKLSDAKGKFVALHFLLKTECPFCLKHTRDYARHAAATPDAVHLFLKPDSEDEIKEWASKAAEAGSTVSIFRDPNGELAAAYKIPDGYQFHGEVMHYPALIILDGTGKEVFRYIGKSNSDRFSIEQFTTKLAELKGKSPGAIQHYNLGPDRIALQGYDPVSYFKQGAGKGSSQISTFYRGVIYHFSSLENKELFVANPERYAPTYGGWCATAMAKGEKVKIDPLNFKVSNGRLFLFFKAFYGNALKDWNKDEANLMAKADAHWRRIASE